MSFSSVFSGFIELFYNPLAYRKYINSSIKHSVFALMVYYLFIAAAITSVITVTRLPRLVTVFEQSIAAAVSSIPNELTLQFSNEGLNVTGVTLPYQITKPSHIELQYQNLFTINPSEASETVMQQSPSLIALGSNSLSYQSFAQATSEVTTLSYDNLGFAGQMDGSNLRKYLGELLEAEQKIKPYLPALIYLGLLISLLFTRTILWLIYSLLAKYLAGVLLGRRYPISSFLNVGVRALMVAEVVDTVSRVVNNFRVPSILPIALLGILLYISATLPKNAGGND